MARNLGFLLALAMMLFSARSAALGLGEITLESALNERLTAEITLLETRGLDASEIIVSLGSREDFQRIGVERFFFLTDLRFEVVTGRNGVPALRISSTQPVTEPFLNFVVQVLWPNGRLLKEYTLLLDPPTFTEQSAPIVAAPARGDPGGSPAGRVQRQPTRPDSQVSFRESPRPPQSPAPQDRTSADSSQMTDRDDTLWSIALRVRPSRDLSVQQTMLAIQRLNPDAFIGGNINLLKAGYRLRLPDESEISSLSQNQAVSQVAEHNASWQSYRRGEGLRVADTATASDAGRSSQLAAQVDATASAPATAGATATQDGELRIVAGATGTAGSGAGGDGQAPELENQLAASEEERDRVSLENEELGYRLDLMSSQMQQTQRQLEVRDQQIAQLQAQLAEIQAQLQAAAAAAPSAAAPLAAAPEGAAASQPAFWQSPYVVIGGAVTLISLIVVGLIMARRRRGVEDGAGLFETEPLDEVAEPVVGDVSVDDDFQDEDQEDSLEAHEVAEEFEPEPEPEETVVASVAGDEQPAGAQTGDVIGEADIYIAYGRYPQAVSLLLAALDDDPDRSEVRLKLLEVHTETKDQAGFDEHIAQLIERCDDNDVLLEARELEARLRDEDSDEEIASTGTTDEGVSGEDDGDETILAPREEAPSSVADDEFSLSLDAEPEGDTEALHDDGFEDVTEALSLSDLQADSEQGHGDELGGDLGMDFDPDAKEAQGAQETEVREAVAADAGGAGASDLSLADDGLDSGFDLDNLELDDLELDESSAGLATDVAVETKVDTAADESEDAFDFLDDEDAATTKLDLARAYIDMGDEDGAREILTEVLGEGSDDQQQQAGELLEKIS
jgi:pilus assembly protein FimV